MADLEALYAHLPVPLQHLACSAEGLRIERRRFGSGFGRLIENVERRAAVSEEEFAALRDRRLEELVSHAAETVPFYRRRFRDAGVDPREIRTLEDLGALPILSKEEINSAGSDLLSTAIPRRERRVVHTSGTTGAGLHFETSNAAIREQWAVWWRHWRRLGIERGTSCGYFVGRSIVPIAQSEPPFWRYNVPQRRTLFSAYHASERNLDAYLDELCRRRPPWFHGYPSLLTLVASRLLERGKTLGYPVRWVTTSAENLLPHQIETMETAFGVRPAEHYGMAEGVANASQCRLGRLHIDEDFAAVEFVPDESGDAFDIVGTSLANRAMPLIRYATNDVASLDGDCPCGLAGRVVSSLDGRREDYIVLGNGARLGRMDHIFKDMVSIREAQIRQVRPGAMTLRIVRREAFGPRDEEDLLRETRKRVGGNTEVAVEYVDEIEREANGKLRFVVSELTST